MSDKAKIVLAYSGGLDTTVILHWLPFRDRPLPLSVDFSFRIDEVDFSGSRRHGDDVLFRRERAAADRGMPELFAFRLRDGEQANPFPGRDIPDVKAFFSHAGEEASVV